MIEYLIFIPLSLGAALLGLMAYMVIRGKSPGWKGPRGP